MIKGILAHHSSPSLVPPPRASFTSTNRSLEYRVVEANARVEHAHSIVMDRTFNQLTASHRHPTCYFL